MILPATSCAASQTMNGSIQNEILLICCKARDVEPVGDEGEEWSGDARW
jgi:hypothetical protein